LSRILFVSKPVVPPWNDSSKNLVRDLALGLARHDAVAFGRRGAPERLGRAEIRPIHPRARRGFSPGLRENVRLLTRLALGERCDAWHFFFAPNPRTSTIARLTARARGAPTIQTVCSVPTEDADLERVLFGDRVVVLSAGPATRPIGEYVIDLPRPRDVSEIRLTPRFIELHDKIWHAMKDEVLKGYAQTRNRTTS